MAAAAIPLAMSAVSSMQKGQEAKAANAQYKNEMNAKAAEQQYSPWTKLSGNEAVTVAPQNVNNSMFSGAMGGLGAGVGANQQAQGMGGWANMLGFGGGQKKSPMAGAQQMSPMAGGDSAPNMYGSSSPWTMQA